MNYISIFKNNQLKYILKGGEVESNQVEKHSFSKKSTQSGNLGFSTYFASTLLNKNEVI